jgi:hypothetical protein
MKLQIKCAYPRQTRDALLADLMPEIKAWFNKAKENSERVLKSPGSYVETQVLGTEWSVHGEPVMMFLVFTTDSETRTPVARADIGSETNVRTTATNQQDRLKELALERKGSSFLEVDSGGSDQCP